MKSLRKYLSVLATFVIALFAMPIIIVNFNKEETAVVSTQEPVDKEPIESVLLLDSQSDTVIELEFSEYLKGVVAAEMPALFHQEALKAQAVAARTYALQKVLTGEKHKDDAPLCSDSTHCKAWIALDQVQADLSDQTLFDKIVQAVDLTRGEVLMYEQEPIQAVFFSTSSGRTESAKDVWGNDFHYLQSVESPGEESSPRFHSQASFTLEDFLSRLQVEKANVTNVTRTEGGGIKSITIADKTFSGQEIRGLFELRSSNFTLEIDGDTVNFHVTGNGHGVGMSQYGANYLASQGKNYQEILKTYYKDVEIIKK